MPKRWHMHGQARIVRVRLRQRIHWANMRKKGPMVFKPRVEPMPKQRQMRSSRYEIQVNFFFLNSTQVKQKILKFNLKMRVRKRFRGRTLHNKQRRLCCAQMPVRHMH